MNVTDLLLFVLLISSITYSILIKRKLIKIKKKIVSLIKDVNNPLRLGYYKLNLEATNVIEGKRVINVIVYVNEIHRYKNGDSKIKFKNFDLEVMSGSISHDKVKDYVINNFISIVKTSSIEWLDEIEDIKESRKLKIKNLEKILKNK